MTVHVFDDGSTDECSNVHPAVVQRPTPLFPSVFSVAELDAWLAARIEQEAPAVLDSETIGHIGWESHKKAEARYGTLVTIRELIEARPASDIDWRELIGSFIVAILLTVAGIVTYFWAYAAELGS